MVIKQPALIRPQSWVNLVFAKIVMPTCAFIALLEEEKIKDNIKQPYNILTSVYNSHTYPTIQSTLHHHNHHNSGVLSQLLYNHRVFF